MDFADALTRAYLANPCRTLPNALWKTLAGLKAYQTGFQASENSVEHLEIWQENRLLLIWDYDHRRLHIPAEKAAALTLALIHQEDFPHLEPFLPAFSSQNAFFRLVTNSQPEPASLTTGFSFRPVDFEHDIDLAADLIGRCYADLHPSPEMVRSWTRHPVFASWLWIWVWDDAGSRPAGLGIAEIDPTAGEGSLEWIQVLPEYRGLRLGQALVLELLARMQSKAAFVTVSGEVDNTSHPERLYRRCGFTGRDVWYLFKR